EQRMLPVLICASRAFRDVALPWLYYEPKITSVNQFRKFMDAVPDARGRWIHKMDLSQIVHRWHYLSEKEIAGFLMRYVAGASTTSDDTSSSLLPNITPIVNDPEQLQLLLENGLPHDHVAIFAVAQWCPQIRKLDLSGTEVADPGILAIANACRELRWLSLYGCEMITDDAVFALRSGCPRLRWLDLTDCYGILSEASIFTTNATEDEQEETIPNNDIDAGWETEEEEEEEDEEENEQDDN
ncbi:hypothetical protein BDF22DRAFT_621825, partial [Syncephalis plumigaleata]